MARIRTIKPEFFTSEDIVGLSPFARLLYIALWCEADKEGRLVWKPKTFKMRWLPGDACDIEALCKELADAKLVVLYGDGLAYIPGFSRHQHVNPRESASDLPAPAGVPVSGPRKVGKNTREAVFERDGHACVRCGSTDHLQADHILPQSAGGPHIIENLRTLCRSCNAARPVSGDGLVADLAKDGLTVESLRTKFGIDASISDDDAQGGREGKGKEGNVLPPNGGSPARAEPYAVPDCPHQSIVDLYHQALPNLPRVEVWNDARQGMLRQRWREVCQDQRYATQQGVDWFRDFFGLVSKSLFLTGRAPPKPGGRPFLADLEWLIRPSNFVKVIEGKYQ